MTAIFDLDLTLINGDSSTRWCHWIAEQGFVKDLPAFYKREAELMDHYRQKRLKVEDYIKLALTPVIHLPITEIDQLLTRYIQAQITPIIIPQMLECVRQHQQHREVIIISSSPQFLVRAIAKQCFSIDTSFGVAVAENNGFYTTNVIGTSPYQGGKLTLFQEHRQSDAAFFEDCYFYTDSINDIALLEAVEFPYIIQPDAELEAIAKARHWPIIEIEK